MRLLTVHHPAYHYREPVTFGEHRMMFRPRESHDLRLLSTKLEIQPRPSDIRWVHDVFDNSVAITRWTHHLAASWGRRLPTDGHSVGTRSIWSST